MKAQSRSPFYQVRTKRRLLAAWARVRSNAQRPTASRESRAQAHDFELRAESSLKRIQEQLLRGRFIFKPCQAIPIPKKQQGSYRPLVIAPIESRIVQRAILDVLIDQPAMQPFLETPTSFGAVPGRSVRDALAAAWQLVHDGYDFYIRTDIESFFVHIDRPLTLDRIAGAIEDSQFIDLLDQATIVELEDAAMLERAGLRGLFPTDDEGVAQGCALSPLLGNVLLCEFDRFMNSGDVVCLRYIDDVLILGKSQREVWRGFRAAQRFLGEIGLNIYDPRHNKEKAQDGSCRGKGFEFLGCIVSPGRIRPSPAAKQHLLRTLQQLLDKSYSAMADPVVVREGRLGLIQTLNKMNNIVHGWGNQYSFCNDPNLLASLDRTIDEMIGHYLGKYQRRRHALSGPTEASDGRRLLGVHWLQDSGRDPIVKRN